MGLPVIGAYSHYLLRGLLMGSKTNGLLRAAPVPTLLLR
ncbi:universal stress protein [Aquabacterium sp. A08]|nr:universal stress protein [Aquabacterium sp. A08]NIC39987.1 universal stress protein [Aquabacterium sp. A08]